MPTVGSLAYQIVARHGELTAGIAASRAELRTLKDAFIATQTPVERFSMAIEHLQRQAEKFPDQAGRINRAIAAMRDESFKAAQTPLPEQTRLLDVRMSKLQLVIDPVSLAFQALRVGMDLARTAMAAFEKVAERVAERMQKLDELAKKSANLGVSAESLVGLRGAAQGISGIGSDQFDSALTNFVQRLGEAAISGKGATDSLERLGLKAQDLVSMSPDRALMRVADAISQVKNPSERLQLAFELLGKQGREMATLLAAGGDKIRELANRQRELSQIDWINLDNIQEANDKLNELNTVFTSIVDLLASELSPLVRDVSSDLVDGLTSGAEKGETLRTVIKQIALDMATVVDMTENASEAFQIFGEDVNAFMTLPGVSSLVDMLHFRQEWLKGDPNSRTSRLFQEQNFGPAPMHEEFRKPLSERASERGPVEQAERGHLTVGRPPGEVAFEQITKAREELIKLEEKRAQTELKAWQERQDAARKVMLETRTDAEKLVQRFAEIRQLPLDDDTRRRALEEMRLDALDLTGVGITPRTVSAVRAGSVEALRAQFGPRTDERALAEQKKTAANTQTAASLLEQINKSLSELAPIGAKD